MIQPSRMGFIEFLWLKKRKVMQFIQSNISKIGTRKRVQRNSYLSQQCFEKTAIAQQTALASNPAIQAKGLILTASLFGLMAIPAYSFAAENEAATQSTDQPTELPKMQVTAQAESAEQGLHLNQVNRVGSSLNLKANETPATVETYTQEQMQQKGLRTVKDAFSNITGAIVGNVPGNPAVLSMRGFTGSANSVLIDGVRIAESTMMMRDLDSWKYEKIEVLKGPASVLYGLGSLGGTVNMITRKPSLEHAETDGMLSYGSFNTVRAALSTNKPVNDSTAVLFHASYSDSDSLYDIDDQDTKKVSVGTGLLYQPNDALSMLFTLDHDYDKQDSTYQGSPVLPANVAKNPSSILKSKDPEHSVLDKSIRHRNYNPDGAYSSSESTTLNWTTDYKLGSGWTLNNVLSYFKANRDFFEAPNQTYNAETGKFDRDIERITHDHEFWSNRLSLSNDSNLFGKYRNRFSLGAEYNHTDLTSLRQFASFGSIDPFSPQGQVGQMPSTSSSIWDSPGGNSIYKSKLATTSIFAEDAFNLTPDWLLVGGVRFDHIDAERNVIDLYAQTQSKFNPTFNPVSWRVGSIYNITPDVQVYGQYSTAITPVSSLLLISSSRADFKLSEGKSAETGFKASLFDGKTDVIGSIYWIELNDILTRDPQNTSLTVQGGSQTSRGAELTASTQLTSQLRADLGLAWVDAKYHDLLEPGGDRTGNRPVNVPKKVANASINYKFNAVPVSLTAYGKYVDGFYTDTANTYYVKGHTTLDASISYELKNMTFTLWGRNLSNEYYGEYSGYSPTQIFIGAPRSVELAMTFKY